MSSYEAAARQRVEQHLASCHAVAQSLQPPALVPLFRGRGCDSVVLVTYALVDVDDYEAVNAYRWRLSSGGYAGRVEERDGRPHHVLMHRQLMGLVGDALTDHINRNKLDNRRVNLRVVTASENSQNLAPRAGRTSTHRGVAWDTSRQRWRAEVTVGCRTHHLGRFLTEDAAADAAETFRRTHMPFSEDAAHV